MIGKGILAIIITLIAVGLLTLLVMPSSAGNVTVYEVGADYIIWNTGGNITHFWLDGNNVPVYCGTFGQYGLTPNTPHTGCEENVSCTTVTTLNNGISVFYHWLVFLILIGFCIVSYYIPVTQAPALIYAIYLIQDYLPSINAPFEEMLLASILMICGILSAIVGWSKR